VTVRRALGGEAPWCAGAPRIGLLGGSFNPAHAGHLHLSLLALKLLRLDRVWWLVSPQNPLKPTRGMAPLPERLAQARKIARHPRLLVTDLEQKISTQYTRDTVKYLTGALPNVHFVWLMGADNLGQIDRWESWTELFESLPIAVFARPNYSSRVLSGKAARRYERARLPEREAALLADTPPPAWVFLHTRLHPASASSIRAGGGTEPGGMVAEGGREDSLHR
jgi:nicotinate-nucleotide adenylyltransferase